MKRRNFLAATTASLALAPLGSLRAATAPSPRIARIWRGRTVRARADAYADYLYEKGIKVLEASALGVQLFREDRPDDTEFVVISYWESVEAMSRFAGPEPLKVFPLPRDPEFLLELPKFV